MMRALLIGYGKMGRKIAEIAPSYNVAIAAVVDHTIDELSLPKSATGYQKLSSQALDQCDIVIDFSSPEHIVSRIELLAEAKKPIVMGTTGWHKDAARAKEVIEKNNSTLLASPNFSLGVALFLQLARQSAKLLSRFSQYDVGINELHHRRKQDGPSGTALKLAHNVVESYPKKKVCMQPSRTEALADDQLHVSWQRIGSIPGTHELIFDSPDDTIALTHTARSREGFARGALDAAYWVIDKKGWFTLDDMITDKLRG